MITKPDEIKQTWEKQINVLADQLEEFIEDQINHSMYENGEHGIYIKIPENKTFVCNTWSFTLLQIKDVSKTAMMVQTALGILTERYAVVGWKKVSITTGFYGHLSFLLGW